MQGATILAIDDQEDNLGLAFSTRAVEAMGGAIAVESVEGAGSTFRVTLPGLAPPPPAPTAGA